MGCIKMKQKNLVLLAGIPGSGKSTWLRTHLGDGDAYVSRDEVRFSLVGENEEYFSRETEIFDKFIKKIEEGLNAGKRVYADATHINWASRRKVIERLHDKENTNVEVVFFKTPIETCIERNNKREGRARVPETAIRRMRGQITHPLNDPFTYGKITNIYEDGHEEEMRRGNLGNK